MLAACGGDRQETDREAESTLPRRESKTHWMLRGATRPCRVMPKCVALAGVAPNREFGSAKPFSETEMQAILKLGQTVAPMWMQRYG
jgi:hypothetical protein